MLRYELINKEWIVSPKARRVYRTSAVVSLALLPLFVAAALGVYIPLLKQLLFVSVVATAINGVGMEFFLFRFDRSAAVLQIVWFCALVIIPLGPALYCFIVYSRSEALKMACAASGDGRLDTTS
jgi:hypothetical protein